MELHAVFVRMIEAFRQSGRPQLCDGSPDDARALVASSRAALGVGPEPSAVRSVQIPTRDGTVPGRLVLPVGPAQGLIVYLHGGGWVVGTLDDFDTLSRTLVARSGCALLLVDYRLAPEHPFPAGLHDVEDAIRWAAAQRIALAGGDVPLVVAGDSAGGNLATVAALSLRREVALALQVLFYPVTDVDTDTASYRAYADGYLLTRSDMQWFLRHYAGEHAPVDPRIAPLRGDDLSGAPNVWMAIAEYDVLRDECEAYARRLAESGVAVQVRRYADMPHGFARMTNLVDAAEQAVRDAGAAIAQRCAQAQANPNAGAFTHKKKQHG